MSEGHFRHYIGRENSAFVLHFYSLDVLAFVVSFIDASEGATILPPVAQSPYVLRRRQST